MENEQKNGMWKLENLWSMNGLLLIIAIIIIAYIIYHYWYKNQDGFFE